MMLRPLLHRRITCGALVRELHALGVRSGGVLLIHSSLSSLGYIVGGAASVVRSLLATVGAQGTLVFPAHSWEEMEAGGRVFDARNTASCVGKITECARQWPGAIRSLHPTHSVVAIGPMAAWLTAGHEHATTPCGRETPYDRILDSDGQILLLGVGLEANTVFHTVEAICGLPYLLHETPEPFVIIDEAGRRRELSFRRHRASVPRRFLEMDAKLRPHAMRVGQVGQASAALLSGAKFLNIMRAAVNADPTVLLGPTDNLRARPTHGAGAAEFDSSAAPLGASESQLAGQAERETAAHGDDDVA